MKVKGRIFSVCLTILTVLAFTPFIQGGCSSGGGGGGNDGKPSTENTSPQANATLTDSNAAEPAEVLSALPLVVEAINMGGSTSSPPGSAGSLSAGNQGDLFSNIQSLINRVAAEMERGDVHALGSYTDGGACDDGGNSSIAMSWDGPAMDSVTGCSDMSNIKMDLTANNCNEMGAIVNGTMSVSIPGSSCNLLEGTPSSMIITISGTIDDPSAGISADYDHFSINVSNLIVDASIYEVDIPQMDAIINGSVSGTIDGESESVSFSNFSMTISEQYESSHGYYYYSMTLDGLVQTTCLSGWVKMTTTTPIAIPDTPSNACPFAGSFDIQGGNTTATITALDPGVEITLNGATSFYATCDDVPDACLQ